MFEICSDFQELTENIKKKIKNLMTFMKSKTNAFISVSESAKDLITRYTRIL